MADTIDVEEGRLVGEASHAAGNLIHRLYYLTELLEDVREGGEANEALQQLKDALGELHVLVARSMALLKPVNVKTLDTDAAAVACSVARRLGAENDPVESYGDADRLRAMPVEVDPGQLDRAVGLLAEAVTGRGAHDKAEAPDGPCRTIRVDLATGRLEGDGAHAEDGLIIRCTAERDPRAALTAEGHVAIGLAVAVATRVLRTFRCDARFEENRKHRVLIIFVPASASVFSKTDPR